MPAPFKKFSGMVHNHLNFEAAEAIIKQLKQFGYDKNDKKIIKLLQKMSKLAEWKSQITLFDYELLLYGFLGENYRRQLSDEKIGALADQAEKAETPEDKERHRRYQEGEHDVYKKYHQERQRKAVLGKVKENVSKVSVGGSLFKAKNTAQPPEKAQSHPRPESHSPQGTAEKPE